MSALTDTFTAIANAIRAKSGGSNTMTPSQMVTEINNLPKPTGTVNLTTNGTHDVTNYASANVDVAPLLKTMAVTVPQGSSVPYTINFGVNAKYVIVHTTFGLGGCQVLFDIQNNRHIRDLKNSVSWISGLNWGLSETATVYYLTCSATNIVLKTYSFSSSSGTFYFEIFY